CISQNSEEKGQCAKNGKHRQASTRNGELYRDRGQRYLVVVARTWTRREPDESVRSPDKGKIDFGFACRHDVGDGLARAGRHRPAERAVSRVEKQIGIASTPDDGNVGRRSRTQACPVLDTLRVDGIREPLLRAAGQRL